MSYAYPDDPRAPIAVQRAMNRRARNKLGAGRHRGLEEYRVQIAPRDGGAGQTVRIVAGHSCTEGPCDDHPFDRYRAFAHATADSEPIEDGQRAGVERIAAEFVTRKPGAIDEAHVNTGTRQNERRDAARRPGADDHCVPLCHHARPSTSALFLDPNPRQLQSAASTSARRAVFGMKSMSHAGS